MNTRKWKIRLTCLTAIQITSVWALYAAVPVSTAAATAPTPVNAIIDASKTFAPINPNLYGMFIEHAGNLVYGLCRKGVHMITRQNGTFLLPGITMHLAGQKTFEGELFASFPISDYNESRTLIA